MSPNPAPAAELGYIDPVIPQRIGSYPIEREVGRGVGGHPRARALDAHAPPFLARRTQEQRDRVG